MEGRSVGGEQLMATDTEKSGAESEVEQPETDEVRDEGRSALLEAVSAELGDDLVEHHLVPGRDLWLRVSSESWAGVADYLHNRQRFRFFDWLSAIDWLQSPFGRSHTAAVDDALPDSALSDKNPSDSNPANTDPANTDPANTDPANTDPADAGAEQNSGQPQLVERGYAGGDTRFQVVARVYSLTTKLGVTIKADLGDDLSVATWTEEYPGADWHEREAFEMFGINFAGHPGLRKLYLPGEFEGHPMRKDFPLLARIVKPWPGIVDVEPMPEVEAKPEATLDNPQDAPPDGSAGAGGQS